MKSLCILIFALSLSVNAQGNIKTEFVNSGNNLVKVISYHEDGSIAQTGYLKDNKLHGEWASFDMDGNKLALGTYKMGKKNGKWFFWSNADLTEVDFEDNVVIDTVNWENKNLLANNNL